MNPKHENRLEAMIDRELKQLPELKAPETLMPKVMMRLAAKAATRKAGWQSWSKPMQWLSLAGLTLFFGALCWGAWVLLQSPEVSAAEQRVHSWYAGATLLWAAFGTVFQSLLLALRQLGTGYLLGLAAAALIGYAFVVGLGTVYLRVAFARR